MICLHYIDIDDSIDYYVVQKEHKLIDLQKKVEVIKIGGSSTKFVTVDKFLTHNVMIFTVPLMVQGFLSKTKKLMTLLPS